MTIYPIVKKAFDAARFVKIAAELPAGFPVWEGKRLRVDPALLESLARNAFGSIAFYLRENHLGLLAGALADRDASENDRLVIETLLRNAAAAAKGELALCQDTGTACVYAWKDEALFTEARDEEALSRGIARAYRENHLRASETAPSSFFGEYNTGDNLPAQIRIEAVRNREPAYRFLFTAKGGGSANKTAFFSMTKALLEKDAFLAFLKEKIHALGTAACPPYRIAVVVGGPSPEFNLEINKLATTEILDASPFFREGETAARAADEARNSGWLRRDAFWEKRVMELGRESGLGAQFGGKYLLLDAKVFRMPRHAASCPVSIGVSCSAHRTALGYIDKDGVYLESLVKDPAAFLRANSGLAADGGNGGIKAGGTEAGGTARLPEINLDRPMEEIRRDLARFRAKDKITLSGKLLVARDAAHLKWHELLCRGGELPAYLLKHPVYYAGPSETPPGKVIGSLGPTTAQRMDPYGEELMSRGAALVTLSKGNRGPSWKELCRKYGGFYLGVIGGAAALLAEENIVSQKIVDYPELGMEAVRLIEVRRLLAFIIHDDKGGDLYDCAESSRELS